MAENQRQLGIEAWSPVEGVILESYLYAPGPASESGKHSHEDYQLGLSLDFPGEIVVADFQYAWAVPGNYPSIYVKKELRTTEQTDASVQRLVDEAGIVRVVDGIDDAVDAKDWEACRAYFADEIYVDFTSLAGGEPGRIPADNLVGAWRTNLYADKPSFHMRTNHRVSVDGDRAGVLSKAHALNILLRDRGSDLWETWSYYVHTLERRGSGWICTGMTTYTVQYAQGNEMVREYVPEAGS